MNLKSKIIGFGSLVLVPIATTSVLISCSNKSDVQKKLEDFKNELQNRIDGNEKLTQKFLQEEINKLRNNINELKDKLEELGTKALDTLKLSKDAFKSNFEALVNYYKKIKDDSSYIHKDPETGKEAIKIKVLDPNILDFSGNLETDKNNFILINQALEQFSKELNSYTKKLENRVVELKKENEELRDYIKKLEKIIEDANNSIDGASKRVDEIMDIIGKVTSENFDQELEVNSFISKNIKWDNLTKIIEVKDSALKSKKISEAYKDVETLTNDDLLKKLGITSEKLVISASDKVTVTYKVDSIQDDSIKIKITVASKSKTTVKNENYSFLITGFKK